MAEVGKAFVNVEFDENQVGRDLGDAVTKGFKLAGVAVAAASAGLFAIGSSFDSAFDAIRIQTGETGAILGDLEESFRDVVSEVPTSFGDAAEAIAGLNQRLDLTGDPLEDLAGQFLELTRLTGGDLSTNIDGITRLLGDWSIPAGEAAGTLDQLFRASQATGTGIEDLAAAAVQFGGPMRQLGFTFEETIALVGKFNKEGVNTELVMGSLRIALGRMARAGEAPAETLARVVEQIKNAGSAGEANALALELFGARAGPDMAAAIREGRFEIDGLVDTITNGSDTIAQASADTADFGEKWTLIKNRIFLALEPIATKLFDAIGNGMDKLGPIVGKLIPQISAFFGALFTGFTEDEGTPVERFALRIREAFKSIVAFVGPIVAQIGAFFKTLFTGFTEDEGTPIERFALVLRNDIIPAIVAAFQWMAENVPPFVAAVFDAVKAAIDWFSTNVVPVIQAVVGFIAEQWENLSAWTREHWDGISEAIGHVIAAITVVVKSTIALITRAWEIFGDDILKIVKGVWDAVVNVIQTAVDIIRGVIEFIIALINGEWGDAWDALKGIVGDAVDGILDIINNVLSTISGIIGGIFDLAKTLAGNALDAIVEFVKNLPMRLLEKLGELLDAGASLGGAILEGLGNGLSGIVGFLGDIADAVFEAFKDAWNSVVDLIVSGFQMAIDAADWALGPWINFDDDLARSVFDFAYLHEGGMVPGPPGADVPAILQAGEFVMSRDMVDNLGSSGMGDPFGGWQGDVIVNNPVPEEASESVPRQMKNLAWLMGGA